jgi:hypothetical protein
MLCEANSSINRWAIIYYMPLYFQAVEEYLIIISGVALLSTLLVVAPSAAICAFAIRKIGSYRKILWVGWTLACLGAGIMLKLDLEVTIPQWIFINIVGGIGIGILLPVMSTCPPSPYILCPLFDLLRNHVLVSCTLETGKGRPFLSIKP